MLKRMKRLLFLLLIAIFSSATAQVLTSPQFSEGSLKFINTVDIYSTTENFGNSNGAKTPLSSVADGNEYSNITADLSARYGMGHNWELYGGLKYSQATSISSKIQRTQSALSDLNLGINYRWIDSDFSVYPGFFISFPLVTNDLETDDVLVNEGASVIAIPFYFDYRLKIAALYAGLTPALIGDGRGARVFYTLGIKKRIGSIIFNLEYAGMDTIKDDDFTATPDIPTAVVDRVNGGSFRYFSVNPAANRIALQARMKISNMFR